MAATQFGRYRLSGSLGKGGMGEVYLAYDPDLDREVALKVIDLPSQEHNSIRQQRFKREVQAAARLSHPHIVTIYDVSLEHQLPYVVMELLTGGTLRERLQTNQLPWPQVLSLLRPLILALAYAHQAGVIHRDVKPGNIMFTGGDVLKLVDFGLAYRQDGATHLTHSGDVFGTPAYMSPEQARGEPVDGRTDLFALGIILFEAITGRNPLVKGSTVSTLLAASDETPFDLTPLVELAPPEVIGLIEQTVAKNRAQRYPTGEALLTDLDLCLSDYLPEAPAVPHRPALIRRPSTPLSSTPTIHKAGKIELTPAIETVLRAMFSDYSKIIIDDEFGHGLSGGRVFRISPIKRTGDLPELPVVVKVALLPLIHQEWQAYQTWVTGKLSGAARLEAGMRTLPPGSRWDGLRYSLAGDDVFKVQSLQVYYDRLETNAENLISLLEQHLFPRFEKRWWLNRHTDYLYLQDDYDTLLPVNLLIKPQGQAVSSLQAGEGVNGPPAEVIRPDYLPEGDLKRGDQVELLGWVVTEVDLERHQVTLNLPPPPEGLSASYRLRLVEVVNPDAYRVGQIIDPLPGVITETRQEMLMAAARQAVGETIDLTTNTLPLRSTPFSPIIQPTDLPVALPNPLLAYPALLDKHQEVNIAIIHGDLNLENILVRPDNCEIYLIDFVTVRQGHALHDLLRLETEVITKLIPPALVEANLPPTAIYPLYQQLHLLLQGAPAASLASFPPALHKPVSMLIAIRKMARACLFKPDEWSEYYRGLVLYLLGALKFKNLDELPITPLPKQVAFWAAASAVELSQSQPAPVATERASSTSPAPNQRWPWQKVGPAIIGGIVLVLAIIFGLTTAGVIRWPDQGNRLVGEEIAMVIGFTPEVRVKPAHTDRLDNVGQYTGLYHGDTLITLAGAKVDFSCKDGPILRLPEQRNIDVAADCRAATPMAEVITPFDPALNQLVNIPTPASLAVVSERGSRTGEDTIPLLLSPRNSVVTEPRPTFRWQPVTGAKGYRLTIISADGKSWKREPAETTLTYPADAPALTPGIANIVELSTLADDTAVDRSTLRLADQDTLTQVVEVESKLNTLSLQENSRRFLLVQLYNQHQLWSAAIEQLKQLTAGQPASAQLWQQLGDLYTQVELYAQAEAAYHQALTAATNSQDLTAQAAAEIGLARVVEDTAQAIDHLTAAESLYRQAGQLELAEQVADERAKLE